MWKKVTLSILAALVLLIIGKVAYDQGYTRGRKAGRIDLANMYADTPEKFVLEAEIWCTAEMIEGYKTLGVWPQSDEEAKTKLYNFTQEGCRAKVKDATLRLAAAVK